VPLATDLPDLCFERLGEQAEPRVQHALAAAAIREMVEETGLRIAAATDTSITTGWDNFDRTGEGPDASLLHYFFRAITPPGRTRRFDARFFLLDADALAIDLDDFTKASDELSHLQWVPLPDVRRLNLPFITSVALGEVAGLTQIAPPPSIPFFENGDEESLFHRLGG
ncbi:MAG: NUDIX domain-containing protein, partial [Planktomarina sp.]